MHDKETESLSKYTRFFGNRQWKSLFSAVFLTALSQERAKLSQNRQRFFYHKGFAQAHIIEYTFGVNDVQTQSFTDLTQKVREAIYKLRSKCKFTNAFSTHDLSEVYIADC